MIEHSLLRQQQEFIEQEIKQVTENQKNGLYPLEFPMPIGVQFELTMKCNLYCKHCYNASGEDACTDRMDISSWLSVIDNINENGGVFQCIISGGEPLLYGKNMFTVMDALHEKGTGFILITNGMLIRPSTVKKLQKYNYYWVQVSIDDFDAAKHDDFRGVTGSWDKAIEAAFLLSSAGLPLRIAHSVTPENLSRLPDMVDLAYQLGASSIVCGAIMPSGRASNDETIVCTSEGFLTELYNIIQNKQCEYNGRMEVLSSSNLKEDIIRKKNQPNSAIVVRPNGDVRMDCTMPFVLGNVFDDKFSAIWKKHGNSCWSHPKVNEYISKLDMYGEHPEHKNHTDLDIQLDD
ncbi:hypothetical protein AB733_04820 [Photobacterium swingsii]|uniref:Radical SAM protein n=1 Tax=Photobacterium swingsii TaxID=680026 RepID=A0A0J8VDS2_9GAMM|nr:radical SAM protein [Photobacterium swingsii]KMV31451.1 hypothetical protein AB733_04820 [Photobacterium swingsii]PSW25033.1 radical SAM protein [Photobacterium swingsii]